MTTPPPVTPSGQPAAAAQRCPYLGLRAEPNSIFAQPTHDHRCYVGGGCEPIVTAHQADFCLTTFHEGCPRFEPIPAEGLPVRGGAPPPRLARVPLLGLAAVSAVLFLLGATIFMNWRESPARASADLALALLTPSPTLTATASPTALTTAAPEPVLAAQPTAAPPRATLPPGSLSLALTPDSASVGWVSSGDPFSHFGERSLHAGSFDGRVYHGLMQFTLAAIPPGSTIEQATLELTGLSSESLGVGGSWLLQLLDPAVDEGWASITFQRAADAAVSQAIGRPLTPAALGVRQTNTFTFDASERAEIERRLATGLISFRLDGPPSREDNLFTWDTGYGGGFGRAPVLRLIYQPPPTPTPLIITNTPTPENVVTAAALAAQATYAATVVGTPTPLPEFVVTATPPIVIVPTTTPANEATAAAQMAEATAIAFLFGTPTPWPTNAWTATPGPTETPGPPPIASGGGGGFNSGGGGGNVGGPRATATALPLVLPFDQITPIPSNTPAASATATPAAIPAALRGKIAFFSDRLGQPEVFLINPDGTGLALLTDQWAYFRAKELDMFAPGRRQRLFVQKFQPEIGPATFEIWIQNTSDGLTGFLAGRNQVAYDPVWSPDSETIAYVAQTSGNDEIYTINKSGQGERRLTINEWEWDKHPSFSPDGSQIVFWSNRGGGGTRGLWLMTRMGDRQRPLLQDQWNNWDPVWIK